MPYVQNNLPISTDCLYDTMTKMESLICVLNAEIET